MQTDAGLATAMRISITRLARRLRVERLGLGGSEAILSDIQLAALAALERHDAMTPGEHEKVQLPSVTRVIAVLEERGLVRRAAHPTDRRQVILTVTQQGRDVVQLVRRRREAWLAQRLQELTDEERATLLAAAPILEKLSQSLDGAGALLVKRPLAGFLAVASVGVLMVATAGCEAAVADADEQARAGAVIVFRSGPRFPAARVIVFRYGRYTTRKTHAEPYVRSCLLSVVTMRTVSRCPAAVPGIPPNAEALAYVTNPKRHR
jgi:DNA-binding MarR family transcriptional regulator